MKSVIRFMGLIVLSLIVGVSVVQPGLAARHHQTTQQNDVGFSVAAQLPKNQIHKEHTFFDLKMTTGQQQTLKTTIYNVTNRDIKVQTAIHTAYTNGNGVIEYINPAATFDRSLKNQISHLAKVQGAQTVSVPAKGTKVVSIKVRMPAHPINGVLLGGWYFKRITDKSTGTVEQNINVTNEYSYVIGLKLTSGTVPTPKLVLGTVKAGLSNYHRSIIAALRNPTAVIVPNLKVRTVIVNQHTRQAVIRSTKKGIMMAPNTIFKNALPLKVQSLQPGTYELSMTVSNHEHRWQFKRTFHISMAAAQQYNHEAVDNHGMSMWILIGIGVVATLLVGLGIVSLVWLWRRRSKD
ncbi:DUF916 and DUF3324 domain-containing protein [Lactiplantibacillus paraplantarum]|nr:DUF916 and DUF3324 domain-containing protein [Lactiplantibacillus paraplantarum]MCU4685238.1 DUF916 and DUF3324 domain-containing protein [Lactiplantibacillus paraplantarum]MDL2060997.1 DUF916 and DUF3324 domain-containing protein [Lactiplantibacillus paraplantarum]UKB40281.1 DUF916 and DUF3324 domain-containing protein [Lactiplantibacillus paraplantarum]